MLLLSKIENNPVAKVQLNKVFYFYFMFWPFQVPMNDNSLFISFLRTPSFGNEILGRFEILGFVNFSGNLSMRTIERPSWHLSVMCEATPTKKADSAAKSARQVEKRRIYNKSRKSKIKTRMKKVLIIHSSNLISV